MRSGASDNALLWLRKPSGNGVTAHDVPLCIVRASGTRDACGANVQHELLIARGVATTPVNLLPLDSFKLVLNPMKLSCVDRQRPTTQSDKEFFILLSEVF
jgi:hypothetical protein